MKHTTWLQNRTPTRALEGKTPYEMKNKKKPHLGGIQEFGAAAYVKDLKVRKLDARAQVGRFVGYDSESKEYRIYWPGKRSITIEINIVFNPNNLQDAENITISSGDILSEGERNKVIQNSESNVKLVDKSENESNVQNLRQSEPKKDVLVQDLQYSNTVPFPTVSEPEDKTKNRPEDKEYRPG
jgi:hypothetical protein